MKSGWETKPLGELCDFQRGLTYTKGDEVDISENIVLRATNIDLTTNLLNFAELKYISDKVAIPDSKKVKKDSLIICTASGSKSHLGKVAYIDDNYGYAFGGFMGMITPKHGLLSKYLFHLMTSDAYKDFIGELSDGVNINNLKFDDLKQFQVPHPSLLEQQRIVGILDEALEGIATAKANAEKNLQNTRALFESHLQSVFTRRGERWVETTLGVAYDVRDGTHDSPKYHSTGYPLITSKNLKREGLSFDDIKLIREQDYQKINERSAVHKGDVLFAMIGTIGNPTLVEAEPNFAIKNVALFKMRQGQSGTFLKYYLGSSSVITKMMKEAKGTTQKFVGLGYLRGFPINLPPLAEQIAVVEKLAELEEETQRLESIYQQKLTALDALKKSLLHRAFTGTL